MGDLSLPYIHTVCTYIDMIDGQGDNPHVLYGIPPGGRARDRILRLMCGDDAPSHSRRCGGAHGRRPHHHIMTTERKSSTYIRHSFFPLGSSRLDSHREGLFVVVLSLAPIANGSTSQSLVVYVRNFSLQLTVRVDVVHDIKTVINETLVKFDGCTILYCTRSGCGVGVSPVMAGPVPENKVILRDLFGALRDGTRSSRLRVFEK